MNALRLLVAAAVVTGCNCGVGINGSGVSKVETRELAKPYHRVEVESGLDVMLTGRAPEALVITTDDNLIEHVLTDVSDDGVLRVHLEDHVFLSPKTGLSIEVSGVTLNEVGAGGASHVSTAGPLVCDRLAIYASGGSHIELDSLTGTEAVLWASGASQLKVRDVSAMKGELAASGGSQIDVESGSLGDADVQASGGSRVQVQGMGTQSAKLDVSGGSTVQVSAAKSVTGAVSGGSVVSVVGAPADRAVDISGGSTVTYE